MRKELDEMLRRLERAESIIVEDPETLRGMPVYRGTRIPVELIADMLNQGASVDEILEGYPALDRDKIKIELASLYLQAFPRRVGQLRDPGQNEQFAAIDTPLSPNGVLPLN